jgi:hypothetical protein
MSFISKSFKFKTLGVMTFLVSSLLIKPVLADTPIYKKVPVAHTYVANGFDSNDNVEVVIEGHLPNLCHNSPTTSVKLWGDEIHVKLEALYYEETSPFCPPIIVPFLETVAVGVIPEGQYKVFVNKGEDDEEGLFNNPDAVFTVVKTMNKTIDDFLYARVEYIERELGSNTIKIVGNNPSPCLQFDSFQSVFNTKDTLAILPKVKQVSTNCPRVDDPFEYEFEIPKELQKSKFLLHVRSLEGKSVNKLFVPVN